MKDTEWTMESETIMTKEQEEEESKLLEARELDPEKYPKQINDHRHKEHPLRLLNGVYVDTPNKGAYRCNSCMEIGMGWVYHCEKCSFDLHPSCAIWRRDKKN